MGRKGIELIYGFPNANIVKLYSEKLDWRIFGKINGFELVLEAGVSARCDPKEEPLVEKTTMDFNLELDEFWDRQKKDYKVVVPRNSTFFNWRYFLRPDYEYKVFISSQGGNLKGYIVLKLFKENDRIIGHIVDCISEERRGLNALLNKALEYFKENKASRVSFWFPENSDIVSICKEKGFQRKYLEYIFWNEIT